jgi:hypothetical protein
MNERIKQLADQATTRIEPTATSGEGWIFDKEKFARLIVAECGQLILDKKMGDLGDNPGVKEWEEGYNEAVHDCYYLIRKHFGVE